MKPGQKTAVASLQFWQNKFGLQNSGFFFLLRPVPIQVNLDLLPEQDSSANFHIVSSDKGIDSMPEFLLPKMKVLANQKTPSI